MSAEQIAESVAIWDNAEKNGYKDLSAAFIKSARAVGDTFVPKFEGKDVEDLIEQIPQDATPDEREKSIWLITHCFSEIPHSLETFYNLLMSMLSPESLRLLNVVMYALDTTVGTLALTQYGRPFTELPTKDRIIVFDNWKRSLIPKLRGAAYGLQAMIEYVAINSGPQVIEATGYKYDGDPEAKAHPERRRPSYDYKFENVEDYEGHVLETEILVIGSGCTGGVVAAELATAGYKVLVVEKGDYVRDPTGGVKEGLKMYQNNGISPSEDFSTFTIMGSTFGGGSTVNWSASISPQHFLRKEWAEKYGLPYFLSEDFQNSVEAVWKRMQVRRDLIVQNKSNAVLLEGSRRLGFPAYPLAQNSTGGEYVSGYHTFGDPYNQKQSTKVTFLKDAAEHGTKFLKNSEVIALLFADPLARPENIKPTLKNYKDYLRSNQRTRVIGALLRVTDENGKSTKAIIRATRKTVLCAGTFNSPAILLRSNVKTPSIGSNLRLHPATVVSGEFDESIRQYNGSIMTSVSTVVENVDGHYFGAKLEIITGSVAFSGACSLGLDSAKQWVKNFVRYPHYVQILVLSRDRDSGNIFLDKNKHVRFNYTTSKHDQDSVTEGAVHAAEILIAAGAKRVFTSQLGVPDYIPPKNHLGIADPAWKEHVKKIRQVGYKPFAGSIISAHQMGTLRMGTKPSNSATDNRGRLWAARDLYVADASLFPSSSGANPMITCMALAHSVAQFIKQDLEAPTPVLHL